jgi:vacuolar-type H+-ATPase subunit I/STV1
MLIQEDCTRTSQRPATRILWILTEFYKDRLPKEVYDELKNRYEMTAFEQREAKNLKVKERESKGNKKINDRLRVVNNLISRGESEIKSKGKGSSFWSQRLLKLKDEKAELEAQLSS